MHRHTLYNTKDDMHVLKMTFTHLADATSSYKFYRHVCSLGITPVTLALAPCSTNRATGTWSSLIPSYHSNYFMLLFFFPPLCPIRFYLHVLPSIVFLSLGYTIFIPLHWPWVRHPASIHLFIHPSIFPSFQQHQPAAPTHTHTHIQSRL